MPIGIPAMQNSLDPATKQAILKLIKERNDSELTKLIASKNITWVDKEVAQAAIQELDTYSKENKSGKYLTSPAGEIFCKLVKLEPGEAKRLCLDQSCFYLAKDDGSQ